jgi:Ca2+-binding RTX toxin-like protein
LALKIASTVIGELLPPELKINDVTISEGNSGVSTALFTVTLSEAAALPVSVNLQTADGTATAADGDYTPLAILLTFAPGETVKTVGIEISGDLVFEANETFFLQFVSATGAHIGEFQGTAIIVNDDTGVPVAHDDSATTSELLPVTIAVLANDSDPDGSLVAASLEIAAGPSHGAVQVNALTGVATYTPDVEFSGIDSFRYILKDDGGAVSNVAVVTITVVALPEQSARLQADPAEPGLTALIVKGSSHDDDIRVESEDHGKVKVTIGNKSLGVFAPTGRIIILGGDGNDEIEANGKFAVPVEIHGGAGNDDLRGPSSSAMLIGGSGNDVLIGGSGRDLLIGGTGTDRLFGKSADDLLIGGWTSFDDNAIALASIFSTWTRKDLTFSERVRRLHYGVTGGVQLNSTTVFDDGRNDLLSGGSGIDWTIESGEHCWTVQITKCLGANPSPEGRG